MFIDGEVEPILIEAESINGLLEADRNSVENISSVPKARQQTRSNQSVPGSSTHGHQNTAENIPDVRQQVRLNSTAAGPSTYSQTRQNPGEAVPSTGLSNVSNPFNSVAYKSLLNRSRKRRHDDDSVANAIINAANAIAKNAQRTFIAPTAEPENDLMLYLEANLHNLEGHFLNSFVEMTKRNFMEMTKLQEHFHN